MVGFDFRTFFAQRAPVRAAFLDSVLQGNPWTLSPLGEDWASRHYFRVESRCKGKTFVLMEAVPDHTGAFSPGHKMADFIRLSEALRRLGLLTPEVLFADEQEGFLLLQDFGNRTIHQAIEDGDSPLPFYETATDVLIRLKEALKGNSLSLPLYHTTHIHTAKQRIVDWYIPAIRREPNTGHDLLLSYQAAWDAVEAYLPKCPEGFLHGDFHVQNLMDTRSNSPLLKAAPMGIGFCGILDFQGAMWGPIVYDLANLLEDLRRDVPLSIQTLMLERYAGTDQTLRAWYRVLATQFHCRLIGQVLRLAIVSRKTGYLASIPRLQTYLMRGLQDPVLAPIARWFEAEKVDLGAVGLFEPEEVKAYIRDDAF